MNIDAIIAFENGGLDAQGQVELIASGVKSGMVWQLQGFYGRTARSMIEAGLIDRQGNINQEAVDELLEAV